MTPWKHAQSTSQKWGGTPDDYIHIHEWFDETKQYTGDWTHRALRHHSAGIQWCVDKFGHVVINSSRQQIPTKMIAEQHVQEDCGFIPTPKDYLFMLTNNPPKWMMTVGKKTQTTKLEIK